MAWETTKRLKKVLLIPLKNSIKYTINLFSYTKVKWKNTQCVAGISSFSSSNTFEIYTKLTKKSEESFDIQSYQTKYSIYGKKYPLLASSTKINQNLLNGISFPYISSNCIIVIMFSSSYKGTLNFNIAVEFDGRRTKSIGSYDNRQGFSNAYLLSSISKGVNGNHTLKIIPTGSQNAPSCVADIFVITKHITDEQKPVNLDTIFFENI